MGKIARVKSHGDVMEAAVESHSRRHILIGGGAVLIAGAGAIGYYLWSREGLSISLVPEGMAATSELMAPGPLEEMILGQADAPVTIIEYASMTCPHCARFHEATYPELKKRLIDTGKVRFIFREFPLDQLALAGSALARCVGKDKYFAMVETLFQQQREWVIQKPLEPLLAIARQAGMTQQSFDACLQNQEIVKGIEQVRERAAQKLGVQSTPTLFINGKKFAGGMTIEDIEREVAPYLKP
jgi:protein-disulfide isomerase